VSGTNKAHENGKALDLIGARLIDMLSHTRLRAVPRCTKMQPFGLY